MYDKTKKAPPRLARVHNQVVPSALTEMILPGCPERRGHLSGVIYESLALKDRKTVMGYMRDQNLSGVKLRRGAYYRIPRVQAALKAYLSVAERVMRADGVYGEGKAIGLFGARGQRDFLKEDLFPELHAVETATGDGILHKCIKKWTKAREEKNTKEQQFWLSALRAACLAGADLDFENTHHGAVPLATALALNAQDPLRTLLEFGALNTQVVLKPPSSVESEARNRAETDPHLLAAENNAFDAFKVMIAFLYENGALGRLAFRRSAGGLTFYHIAVVTDAIDLMTEAHRYNEFRHAKLIDAPTSRPRGEYSAHTKKLGIKVTKKPPSQKVLYQTACHKACRYAHYRSLDFLLNQANASPDTIDVYGRTPLFIACEYGYFQCVRLLLEAGADPTCKDARDKTPLDHLQLGISAKTVRRQGLDDYLASFRIFTGKHEKKNPVKAIVDYKKCQLLFDRLDNSGLPNGKNYYLRSFFLRTFLFSDIGPPPDEKKTTNKNIDSSIKQVDGSPNSSFPYWNCLYTSGCPLLPDKAAKASSTDPVDENVIEECTVRATRTESSSSSSSSEGASPRDKNNRQ